MSTGYTPGPWTYEVVGIGGKHDNPRDVCEVTNGHCRIAEYVWAEDARLIAAAPELLEALQEAVALADKNCPDWNDQPHRTPECRAVYDKCRAAITKATGSTA